MTVEAQVVDGDTDVSILAGSLLHFDDSNFDVPQQVIVAAADDDEPLVAEGSWEGFIAHAPRGNNGFGYDPLFFDGSAHKTSAQLEPQEKNRRSHRAKAVRRLSKLLGEA